MSSDTIYIRNIDEKIKIDRLKRLLREEFAQFGDIIDIVAHKNIRLRGQAFVAFDNSNQAEKALNEKNGTDFQGKSLVIEFSKSPSDATVKKQGDETLFEKHKKDRLQAKDERKKMDQRSNNSSNNKRGAPKDQDQQRSSKRSNTNKTQGSNKPNAEQQDTTGSSSRLPKNKVLFLENLSPAISQETLVQIFSAFPGFFEVRLVAVRRVGFVEYETEDQAATAREATMGLVNDGHTVKITFAKK